MRWVEADSWRSLGNFGLPAIGWRDGVCFVAKDGDRVDFWAPNEERRFVRLPERVTGLCCGPDSQVLASSDRQAWLLDSEAAAPIFTFPADIRPTGGNDSHCFLQGLYWYCLPNHELAAFRLDGGIRARVQLDERWTHGPIGLFPHGEEVFCESPMGRVSAWAALDEEGIYLEGARYRGWLVGFFPGSKQRLVGRDHSVCICDQHGNLGEPTPYPKHNPLLSPETFGPIARHLKISDASLGRMLDQQDFVLASGSSASRIRWTSVRNDGSLLAMHEDRLLRRWRVASSELEAT